MKSLLAVLFILASAQVCSAGGSIAWDEVSARLARSAPKLLKVINDSFEIALPEAHFGSVREALMSSKGEQE